MNINQFEVVVLIVSTLKIDFEKIKKRKKKF